MPVNTTLPHGITLTVPLLGCLPEPQTQAQISLHVPLVLQLVIFLAIGSEVKHVARAMEECSLQMDQLACAFCHVCSSASIQIQAYISENRQHEESKRIKAFLAV